MVKPSVCVRMTLLSFSLKSIYGSISFSVPHTAEPYSVPCRNFFLLAARIFMMNFRNTNCDSNQQINRVKRRNDMGKRCTKIVQGREYLFRNVLTLSRSERKADDVTGIAENDIGKVIENEFFYLLCIHSNHLNASFP